MLTSGPKKFAFVHVYKTGGRWLDSTLRGCAPPEWELKHVGLPHAPACSAESGLKLFAFVRNPWDWYVSMYFFYRQHFIDRTGGYLLPPGAWLQSEKDYASMFIRGKLNGIEEFRKNIGSVISGKFVHSQMSKTFNEFVRTKRHQIKIGKFEDLRAECVRLLEWASGEKLPQRTINELLRAKPTNTSRHLPYQQYYNQELIDLVAKHDKGIINDYGYDF